MRPGTDAHPGNANTSNPPTPVTTPEVDPDVSLNLQPTNHENEQLPYLPSPNPINALVFIGGNLNATDFSDILKWFIGEETASQSL